MSNIDEKLKQIEENIKLIEECDAKIHEMIEVSKIIDKMVGDK